MKKLILTGLSLFLFVITAQNSWAYKVGDLVKDFKLKNVDEKMVSLSDYNGDKGVIVVFTCNHCPYAKLYEQRIIELHEKYAPMGYPVVAINPNDPKKVPDDSFENMQMRSEEKQYPFVYLFDETQKTAKDFEASRTPHVFILEKKQTQFRVSYIGAIDDSPQSADSAKKFYVQNALTEMDKGESVEVSETKAIGCTIKWK